MRQRIKGVFQSGIGMQRLVSPFVLVICGVAWGLSVPFGKISISTGYHPLGLIFWQVILVALALLPTIVMRGRRPRTDRKALFYYLVLGLIGTLLPNSIGLYVSSKLPAGIASIILSSIPLFSVAVALSLGSEIFSLKRLCGVLMGLVAVILLVAPETSLPDPALSGVVLIGLLGPLLYAMEGNYVASFTPRGLDPVTALFGASIVTAVLCLPLVVPTGLFIDPFITWGKAEWALVAGSLLHAAAYTGYIWLLGRAGAVFSSQISYVVTLAGVGASALLLSESYSWTVWLALLSMIGGMALVQPRKADPVLAESAA
ncbi:MAG: DMT family transporter [Rhizobiaceae bacterium]